MSIMTFTKDADDIAIVCQGIPWKALATGFFVQHVNNSIFHSRFSSLLLHVFDYGSQETLVKVLKESKLVEGFIEHVRGKHANHGHILLICDQLRQGFFALYACDILTVND